MNLPSLRRALASAVCLSLIAACPGLAPYAAAQAIRSAPAASATGSVPVVSPFAGMGETFISIPSLTPSALSLGTSLAAPSAPTPTTFDRLSTAYGSGTSSPYGSVAPVAAAAREVRAAAQVAAARPAALTKTVSAAAKSTIAALELAGPIANASASSANGVGRKLEDALTGALAPKAGTDLSAPAAGQWGSLPESHQLARPAGDSIAQAAAASVQNIGIPPTPPAGMTPVPQGPSGPFWPRLLSAGLALAPALLLGLPLLSVHALIGGLVIATSLSLAVMPFLGESSPKVLKSAPGLALAILGGAALSLGLGAAGASGAVWIAALAILGGWGLIRYGLGKSEGRYGSYGSIETLSAFFGGLAAMTGVALTASSPLGWTATALLWLSYPLSTLLWFHLPGWVGKGMTAAIEGAWYAALGLSRVLTAIHRDTVLFDRLQKFSRRHWNSSKWNGVWLAVMWTPIMLAEAMMYLVSGIGGLAIGAVVAPVNFLWGSSSKLWPKSNIQIYFAEAAHLVFDNVQNGKVARFNPLEAKLIPAANSPKFLVSAGGSIAIRALQIGWVLYAAVATPILSVAGLVLAFGRVGAYDPKRHDVDSLRIERRDAPSEKPTEPVDPEPAPPSKAPFAPKLIAAALALVPAYFFGLPILAGGSLLQIPLYFALILPLAAMPFMSASTPMSLKSLAGKALFYNGLFFLLNGNAILLGAIAMLGGWGFQRWVKKTTEKDGGFDEAELGAFFGALGAAAAVGSVWAGWTGGLVGWGTLAFAAVTSPFLLMHLPSWVWEGTRNLFNSIYRSMSAFNDVVSFWSADTKFRSNLKKHASYWLNKTYWNGVWLSAIWVPTGLVQAAEFVVSFALGAVIGLIRAPFSFAAAAFKEAKPHTKPAIFTEVLISAWIASSEGSKKLFDRMVSGLKPAMDEASPVTGRPTAKAAGAFLLARFVQLAWLAGVLAMNLSGASFLYGVYKGIRAAFAPAQAYRVQVTLPWSDKPVTGDEARAERNKAFTEALASLTAAFNREKIAYDPTKFTLESLGTTGRAGDGIERTAFMTLTLDARQASVARSLHLRVEPAAGPVTAR